MTRTEQDDADATVAAMARVIARYQDGNASLVKQIDEACKAVRALTKELDALKQKKASGA